MLVKAANLMQLAERYPECTGVFTWNAQENTHMLRVNEALGFTPLARRAAGRSGCSRHAGQLA